MLSCAGCVARPIQEMRLSVAWAVSYCGLVECVCSVAMWFLCVNCGMGCGLPVVMRHPTTKNISRIEWPTRFRGSIDEGAARKGYDT